MLFENRELPEEDDYAVDERGGPGRMRSLGAEQYNPRAEAEAERRILNAKMSNEYEKTCIVIPDCHFEEGV